MSTSNEVAVMSLALEALKESHPEAYKNVIKALEEALAKQEQGEPVAFIDMKEWPPIRFKEGILRCDIEHLDGRALYTTPPKQDHGEPVGIVLEVNNKQVNRDWLALVKIDRGVSVGTKLYTTPYVPTGRQQRKPLTDEQIKKAFEDWAKENYVQGFEPYGDSYHNGHTRNRWQGWLAASRAIEAAHGIHPKGFTSVPDFKE